MTATLWATIIVAVISVGSAVFSGRAARYGSRTQAETEAYIRARKIDTETIERQEKDLVKLRERVKHLEDMNEKLDEDNDNLRRRITRLERLETRLSELGYSVD